MLDPSTSRTLRIYPLETVTRCEVRNFVSFYLFYTLLLSGLVFIYIYIKKILIQVTDSSTLSFWSKSSVDFEPRRIRLQSNSYTTNTLLDIVTAATVQVGSLTIQHVCLVKNCHSLTMCQGTCILYLTMYITNSNICM